MNDKYWTFRVPGTGCLVATPPDSEGLLLFNSTASWIWEHQDLPDLAELYSAHFAIPLAQARADVKKVLNPGQSIRKTINNTTFLIHLEGEDLANEILPRLGPLDTGNSPPSHILHLRQTPHATLIYLDESHLATESLVTAARARVLQELTRLATPDRAFTAILHAGAVGTMQSAAILAGPSFSGKSTLCAALQQQGDLLCLGDDSACLTPSFEVAGMPFALSLREGSWPLFPHLDRPRFLPSNLSGNSPLVPATRLLFVNYDPAATATTLDPVPTFDALVALNQSGFWIDHSQPAIAAFLHWLSQIPIHRLTYSSLSDAVSRVTTLLY